MNKKQNLLSSKEAAGAFKKEVDKSLRLIGFLNSSDKQDVWKYWKAVSSAVKIAVCGKGYAISKPLSNLGGQGSKDVGHNKTYGDLITLRVPLGQTDTGQKRSRVLGIVNEQITDDYIEVCDETDVSVSGETDVYNNYEKISIEDSSQLKSIPAHLIAQLSQLVGHSNNSEACIFKNEEESSNHRFDSSSSSRFVNETNDSKININEADVTTSFKESHPHLSGRRTVDENALASEKLPTRFSLRMKARTSVNNLEPSMSVKSEIFSQTVESDSTCPRIVGIEGYKEDNQNSLKNDSSNSSKDVKLGYHLHINELTTPPSCRDADDGSSDEPQSKDFAFVRDEGTKNDSVKCDVEDHHLITDSNSIPETRFTHQTIQSSKNERETETSVVVDPSTFELQPFEVKVEDTDRHGTEDKDGNNITEINQPNNSLQEQQQLHKSSDIETIISALEEELKKSGSSSGIHSISITSNEGGEASVDIHTTSEKECDQQVLPVVGSQEIVMVQNVEDVIWNPTSDGSIQVLDSATGTLVDGIHISPAIANNEHVDDCLVQSSIDTQYDVVEYEVQAEKGKSCRGVGNRKRKREKDLNEEQQLTVKNKDALDRTCPMCHRVLTYPSSMAAHMRIHTGDRPYSCGQCDRKFTTKANRDRHEATHVGLKPFKCMECEKSFTEKRSLKVHMRSHTGERPFICTVCHRGFAQKCTLMVHMDRHINKKGHLCDLCGKAFRQKSQLDIHVKRHNRQANYPCPECSVKCYTKGDLDRHMIKHTGERPFSCSVCSKTFTRRQYLVDHENSHFGRKPYKCSVCAMAFHDMGSCHRHVKKHRDEDKASGRKENGVMPEPATILTVDDYNSIVKNAKAGKIVKLDDGTKAMVTAVDTDADGITVYHVTCVHNNQQEDDKTAILSTDGLMDNNNTTTSTDDSSVVQDFGYDAAIS